MAARACWRCAYLWHNVPRPYCKLPGPCWISKHHSAPPVAAPFRLGPCVLLRACFSYHLPNCCWQCWAQLARIVVRKQPLRSCSCVPWPDVSMSVLPASAPCRLFNAAALCGAAAAGSCVCCGGLPCRNNPESHNKRKNEKTVIRASYSFNRFMLLPGQSLLLWSPAEKQHRSSRDRTSRATVMEAPLLHNQSYVQIGAGRRVGVLRRAATAAERVDDLRLVHCPERETFVQVAKFVPSLLQILLRRYARQGCSPTTESQTLPHWASADQHRLPVPTTLC